jgi:hypothetical protein
MTPRVILMIREPDYISVIAGIFLLVGGYTMTGFVFLLLPLFMSLFFDLSMYRIEGDKDE